MERMKLTEKEKDQIVKRGAEAMSKIIERMSIEMGELEEENKKLKDKIKHLEFDVDAWHQLKMLLEGEIEKLREELSAYDREYFDEDKKAKNIYKSQEKNRGISG